MSARRRFWPIALGGCLVLVTVLLAAALWRDYNEARRVFNAQAEAYFQELSQHLTRTETMLDALVALFDALEQVDRDQLALFAQDLLDRAPYVATIHLHQRVTEDERPALEARMRRQGYVSFTVHGSNDHRPSQPGVHFPILQIEPLTPETARLLGHDDYSTFPQGAALDDAISSGEAMASFPMEMAQGSRGYRLYRALYATRLHRPPLEQRRRQALRMVGLSVEADRLLPEPGFDHGPGAVRLYHAQFDPDDPHGWLVDRPLSHSPWAGLLPPFAYSRPLPQIGQPLVLELTLQPDPGLVRTETLAETLGMALVLCLLLVGYLQQRHIRSLERMAAKQALERRASHDTLTGLPNRAHFLESLDRALEETRQRQGQLALLFLDLDGFKGINDQLGHAAGDELLRVLAQRTRTGLRQKDMVARLAGDEFTVVLEGMAAREDIARIAQSLLERLNRPVTLAGREIRMGVSIGIALYPDPQGAPLSLEDLVARADQAMYRAKRSGRHRYQFFDQAADDPQEAPPSSPSVAEAATKAVSTGKNALKSSSNPG